MYKEIQIFNNDNFRYSVVEINGEGGSVGKKRCYWDFGILKF